jgi:thiol-disulfide isomerase/thioredoxin
MHIRKMLRPLGLVIVLLALITMVVSASGNLLSASFAQGEQNFTTNMTGKEDVVGVGVHSPNFGSEENIGSVKASIQKLGINNPALSDGMVENQTVTTIKLNMTKFQQIDKSQFKKAPEFAQISGYINTPNNSPITLSSLKGKVVLVYIWTYTCINSIRPMPYIDDWNQKYSDKGLVSVSVHSPEFTFEKNHANVKDAVKRFGINYPVIIDNDHGTWNAYDNNYWPRFYLIDTQGYIRYDHIGEGDYNQIERSIQSLLAERASLMGAKEISFNTEPTTLVNPGGLYYVDLKQSTTPEIYVGYNTARTPLGNPEGFKPDQIVSYSIPSNTNFKPSIVYLQGNWKNNPEGMELQSDIGRIALVYYGKSVNIIAGGKGGGIVSNDNPDKLGAGGYRQAAGNSTANTLDNSLGEDLSSDGSLRIDGQRLYNLAIHNNYAAHYTLIDIKGKGFQFYTFTFG